LEAENKFSGTNSCSASDETYLVQEGDNLYRIAASFGDTRFWESIYIANADLVDNPHIIFPGQEIRIPQNVAGFRNSDLSLNEVLENPFCNISGVPVSNINEIHLQRYQLQGLINLVESKSIEDKQAEESPDGEVSSEELAAFREAFNALVETEERKEEEQRVNEKNIFLELDGMVHDETRSKFGRDFYDIFYTYWQSPPNANNYSIRIQEQPAPSLGSIIIVKVNDDETFKVRLQPKYEFIEEAGKHAVRTTYAYLQDNNHEVKIY
jgi:curli production assembly/transport component CsgE